VFKIPLEKEAPSRISWRGLLIVFGTYIAERGLRSLLGSVIGISEVF